MKTINTKKVIIFLIAGAILAAALVIYAQQKNDLSHDNCPMIKKAESKTDAMSEHHQALMENGTREMGFSQTATTHHFRLTKDGGAIEVEANDATDVASRDQIRTHLSEIAKMFQNGDFKTPFAVHSQMPPGVPEMEKLKAEIRYSYEETEKGARVRIETSNPQALIGVHQFLKFQIEDHRTGDPTSLTDL